ncbi:MFS transporter [Pseudoduganella rhizocola]|uniref:MFS transporter n=1 Tax=Pseudoduganella rhizocola TaxID=3382643 RepID=UPI0038B67B9C
MPPQDRPSQAVKLSGLLFLYWGYIGVTSPFTSLFFAARGMSPGQIAILMSLAQLARIAAPYGWGYLGDRLAARALVLRCTALALFVAYIGILLGNSFAGFFVAAALVHLFASAQRPLSEALLVSGLRGDMGRYGRLRLWGPLGYAALALASGALLDAAGILLMPWITLALLAAHALTSLGLREPQAAIAPAAPAAIGTLLRLPALQAFLGSAFLMLMAHAALQVFYSLYLASLGYSKTQIGMLWAIGTLSEVGMYFVAGQALRKLGAQRLLLLVHAVAVLRFLMIAFGAHSLAALVAAQLLQSASVAAHQTSVITILQRWFSGPSQARGQALLISVSYGLGGATGALGLGWVYAASGPRTMFCAAAACVAAGGLAALLSARLTARPDAGTPAG